MSDLVKVKEALDVMSSAFAEYKKTNDEKIARALAGKGTADLDEKLAKLSATMDKQESTQSEFLKQQKLTDEKREKEYVDLEKKLRLEFEAKLGRAALALGGTNSEDEEKTRQKLQRKAFESLLRKGRKGLTEDEQKVLVIANDTTGGYLAPPQWVLEIIKAVVLFSPMREIVTVRNIGTAELKQPKRTGTASASRVSEIGTRAETNNPAYGLLTIQAPEMFAKAIVSQQNLEDSAFDLEAELTDEFSQQFAVLEGNEVINGDGVGKCLGILDANAGGPGVPISYTPSGTAATIAGPAGSQGDGLINLLHTVKTAYAARGRWIMNRKSLGKVRGLKDTQGRYLWEPSLIASSPATIIGMPYTEAPDMPDEGANAFPIAFGDWKRAYTIAQRLEMVMLRDPYSLADSGQIKFIARRRMGGQVVLGEAIQLYKCAVS